MSLSEEQLMLDILVMNAREQTEMVWTLLEEGK